MVKIVESDFSLINLIYFVIRVNSFLYLLSESWGMGLITYIFNLIVVNKFVFFLMITNLKGFPSGSDVKNLPAVQETWVRSLSWEDPLKKGMATHSSILAGKIPMDRGD